MEVQSQESEENSSDDECLASIKRKVEDEGRSQSYDGDSENDGILPSVFVKVEVEELNGDEEAIDLSVNTKQKSVDHNIHKSWKPPKKKRKRNKCPNCDEVFKNSQDLAAHILTHQVETRHKCDECGRCFSRAFGLRTHMRMHGEKSLKCQLCDATFTTKIYLGHHMLQYHKTKNCKYCDVYFFTVEDLDSHYASVHPGQTPPPKRKRYLRYKESLFPNNSNDNFKITLPLLNKTDPNMSESNSMIDNDPNTSRDSNFKTDCEQDGHSEGTRSHKLIYKKEDLEFEIQCAIANKMLKGRSVSDICEIYNITPDVVNDIWENRDQFVTQRKRKSANKLMNQHIDSKILEWISMQKEKGIQVTGKMLTDTAENLAKEGGYVDFNGSKKWLDRFKQKYSITFRSSPPKRDYAIPPESKWKKLFLEEQWLDAKNGISDEDIFTADEVGVYYNPSKGRIRKLTGKKYIHGIAKDRLSIFLCTNMTGTVKKKLLVVGTEDPLTHSYRNPETLPVTYIRHTEGHFTTQIFEEYVKFWNRELQLQNKRACVILDRATIHSKLTLSNLRLVFVPWKATNSLMPIKNGIYTRFREEFRKLLLEEKALNAYRGIYRHLTCLEALSMLDKAWQKTSPALILQSFESTGYQVPQIEYNETPKSYESDEVLCEFLKNYDVEPYFWDLTLLDNYLTVDDEFLMGQGTNMSVFGGNHKSNNELGRQKELLALLPLATERPENDEFEVAVNKERALRDLEIVRRYLQTNITTFETFSKFMDVENFVMSNTSKL